jgi:hypothetical protein
MSNRFSLKVIYFSTVLQLIYLIIGEGSLISVCV